MGRASLVGSFLYPCRRSVSQPQWLALAGSIYQFLIAMKGALGGEGELTNEEGEVTSHLQGMFSRTIRMLRPQALCPRSTPELGADPFVGPAVDCGALPDTEFSFAAPPPPLSATLPQPWKGDG